jgi:hypothetical protein
MGGRKDEDMQRIALPTQTIHIELSQAHIAESV